MLGIVWFFPRMTVNLLAMAIVSSVYTLLGSLHEEHRLRQYFGPAAYDAYVAQVPFTFPSLNRDEMLEAINLDSVGEAKDKEKEKVNT